ncbi:hydroxymethylpyrimidine/phosphomethylpyrimidine kinase [Alkalithermobacter thermoalcaliphilus JW-YL-7 = DSM 7308]|uniref:Hydroxymethylpyrimidine/phosphomethylpyrimidine kinase n=1 Tax=Alkalithermobacter thermoalcaliphilus JW-YL-7 = DSM 7308 TaxID=1121328 RepID=A0A150FNY6_CLOPD|nr:phosphomethylpyrimidine kinase [[Clostridium] paradoxum JW-YL-7 = DSM 7308]SHK55621.1 hydroxymethylpyrimidine/phosphomethylpyrimidine kinase [[Clostridium] paradoxum JW-YL-7 = DSM 7308]
MRTALTIAGSDSCAGAGIQADLKTFYAHGVYGMSVITAVTAQNTKGVIGIENISADMVEKQLDAIFTDIKVDAVKVGMLSNRDIIKSVSRKLKKYSPDNIVLDPVMVSKSGHTLLGPDAKDILLKELLPLCTIVTPNIPEAEVITGVTINSINDMKKSCKVIFEMGAKMILIKGGHLSTDPVDILFDGKGFKYFIGKRIHTKNTHGTGCTLSSAIASNLAKGYSVEKSIVKAKEYITIAIQNSLSIGKGIGPTNHFYSIYKKCNMLKEIGEFKNEC